jgi:hypothetical protein
MSDKRLDQLYFMGVTCTHVHVVPFKLNTVVLNDSPACHFAIDCSVVLTFGAKSLR